METHKKTNSQFLDRFKGKTSKVDRAGLAHALVADHAQLPLPLALPPRKLASLDTRHLSQEYVRKQDLMESPLPGLAKRATNSSIRTKPEPLPLLYSPLLPKQPKQPPPSRSTSDRNDNLQKRSFGKYLKLDDEALRHFAFLAQLAKRKSALGQHDE